MGIDAVLVFNQAGRCVVARYYGQKTKSERDRLLREVVGLVVRRPRDFCSFIPYEDKTIVFNRYASLFVAFVVDDEEDEGLILDLIQFYVEILDTFFGHVREVDLVYNYEHAYYLLDELVLAGEHYETSRAAPLQGQRGERELAVAESARG